MEIGLDRLEPGEAGTVLRLALPPERAAALTRLGLIPGTEIRCLRRSPLRDPAAYRFRGTVIALRRSDSARITVAAESALQTKKRIEPADCRPDMDREGCR